MPRLTAFVVVGIVALPHAALAVEPRWTHSAASYLTARYGIDARTIAERTPKLSDVAPVTRFVPAVRPAETTRLVNSTLADLDRALAAARAGANSANVAALASLDADLSVARDNARRAEARLLLRGTTPTLFNSAAIRALGTASMQVEDVRLAMPGAGNAADIAQKLTLIQAGVKVGTGIVYAEGGAPIAVDPNVAPTRPVYAEKGTVVVGFRDGVTPAQVETTLRQFGLEVVAGIPNAGVILVRAPDKAGAVAGLTEWDQQQATIPFYKERVIARALNQHPWVLAATLNELISVAPLVGASIAPTATSGVPAPPTVGAGLGWGLVNARFPEAWKVFGGTLDQKLKGTTVGVVDEGFHPHEALEFSWFNTQKQIHANHGNHVLGIIAAKRGSPHGVIGGAPGVSVIVDAPAALPSAGWLTNHVYLTWFLGAISDFCGRTAMRAINVSLAFNWKLLGGGSPDALRLENLEAQAKLFVASLVRCDSLIVSAAGNDADVLKDFPARNSSPVNFAATLEWHGAKVENVIVVESHGEADARSRFSNVGGDLSAPGEGIVSALISGYHADSGTSQAAPFVTAAAALIFAMRPDLSAKDVKKILIRSARPSPSGRPPMLDAASAVRAAEKYKPGD